MLSRHLSTIKRLMFEGEMAGISTRGTASQIEKMTLDHVSKNVKHFLENSLVECYYIGDGDVSDVIETVEKKFASINRKESKILKGY